jgi:hypothetical protein
MFRQTGKRVRGSAEGASRPTRVTKKAIGVDDESRGGEKGL